MYVSNFIMLWAFLSSVIYEKGKDKYIAINVYDRTEFRGSYIRISIDHYFGITDVWLTEGCKCGVAPRDVAVIHVP
jgi:hypothetical protein